MEGETGTRAWSAVVLAGGSGARMGGAEKAALDLGGRTLLDHVLSALDGAAEVLVAGPEVTTSRSVRFVREDPPGGGPVAGLAAAVAALGPAPQVAVVAVDMPRLTTETLRRLREAAGSPGVDAAFLTGADGRRQLAAVLSRTALERALPPPGQAHGAALHRVVAGLRVVDVAAVGEESVDVDSWDDLRGLG